MNLFVRLMEWAYFNRVALLTLAGVGLLGPVGAGSPLLGNVINMSGHGWGEFYFLGFITVAACASAVVGMNLINYYGGMRFNVADFPAGAWVRLGIFALGAAPGGILLISVGVHTPGGQAVPISLGVVTGCALLLAIKILQFGYIAPGAATAAEFYVFPFDLIPALGPWLIKLLGKKFWFGGLVSRSGRILERLFYLILRRTPSGYFIPGTHHLFRGHLYALEFLAVAFAFYFTAGGSPFEDTVRNPWASLNYILMFLTVLVWALAGITFFLDRFRIPLIVPAVLFLTLAGNNSDSDHFYRVQQRDVEASPTPAEIIKARVDANIPIVLVATAGGGIQAAAWTSEVLDHLSRMNGRFEKSLVMVSGASGGSVGAMFYTQTKYERKRNDSAKAAMQSSLESVAWGWLKPDVARAIFPYFGDKTRDRGLALEQTWERRLGLNNVPLSDWAKRVRDRGWPALIFNSTAIEGGEPMLFSTSSPGKGDCADTAEEQLPRFHEYYGRKLDVNVATAARMGATFPFVSPAARPSANTLPDNRPGFHLVDGGYYDNYGVGSLVGWLEDGLSDPNLGRLPERVLIVRVRSFADAMGNPAAPERGWFFQTWAPILGLYNVRDAAQKRNADRLLSAVRTRWAQPSPPGTAHCIVRKAVAIEVADLVYPQFPEAMKDCNQPPLSWRLNPIQQSCIPAAWLKIQDDQQEGKCLQAIDRFIAGGSGIPAECDALRGQR